MSQPDGIKKEVKMQLVGEDPKQLETIQLKNDGTLEIAFETKEGCVSYPDSLVPHLMRIAENVDSFELLKGERSDQFSLKYSVKGGAAPFVLIGETLITRMKEYAHVGAGSGCWTLFP